MMLSRSFSMTPVRATMHLSHRDERALVSDRTFTGAFHVLFSAFLAGSFLCVRHYSACCPVDCQIAVGAIVAAWSMYVLSGRPTFVGNS